MSSFISVPSIKKVDDQPKHNDAELARVQQQIEVYKQKIAHERARIENANQKIIQHEQQKALEQKSRAGNDDAHTLRKIEKEKQILTDKLNHRLSQLNKKIDDNKQLRKKIDSLRLERVRYDEIYTKLEHDVQKQTKQMAQVLEQGKQALKARDKATADLDALTKQNEESKAALQRESAELHELEELFRRGEQLSAELLNSRPNTVKSQKASAEENQNEENECDDELAMDTALAKIKTLTGIDDIDQLIKAIEEKKELRFGLFTRINEIEEQMSKNEAKIASAELELKQLQRSGLNANAQKQKEMQSLQQKQLRLEANAQEVDNQHQTQLQTLNSIREKIETVHSNLGLAVPEDVIGTDNISEMEYLAAIEQKVTDILTTINGDYEDDTASIAISPSKAHCTDETIATTNLELPSANGLVRELDGERPFTMEELQQSLRATA